MLKSGRRHTRWNCDWSSDVCSSDLYSYTLSATIDNDSKVPTGNDTVDLTGFNDSVALTVHGIGGTTASDNLVLRAVDDTPTAANDGPFGVVEDGASLVSGNVLTNDISVADTP